MKLLNTFLFSCVVFYGQQLRESSVYVEPDVYQECNNIDPSKIDYCLEKVATKLDNLDSKRPKPKKQIKLFEKLKTDLENKKKVLDQKQKQKNKIKERAIKERIQEDQTLTLANPSRACLPLWVNPKFSPKRGGLATGFVTKSYVTFTNHSDLSVDIRSGTGEDVVLSLCPKTTITIGVNNSYSDYSYEYTMIAVDIKGKTSVFRFYGGYLIDDRRTYFFDIN